MSKTLWISAVLGLLLCADIALSQAQVDSRRPATAPAPAQARSRPAIEEQVLSVQEFQDNIRLDEALAAIRAKLPDFNYAIVRGAGVREDYPTLPKMNVKNLQLGQFIDFIRANYAVNVIGIGDSAAPFYTFSIQASGDSVNRGGRRGGGFGGGGGAATTLPNNEPSTVTVYRLTPIINGLVGNGLAKDSKQAMTDILSLLESVLNQSPDLGPSNLKVHEPTQMLTFHGTPRKGNLLEETLRKMEPPANEAPSQSAAVWGLKQRVDRLEGAAQATPAQRKD